MLHLNENSVYNDFVSTKDGVECYLTAHPESMSLFRKGRKQRYPVQVHDLQTNIITAYPSVTVAESESLIFTTILC